MNTTNTPKLAPETELEKYVTRWIEEKAAEREDGIAGALEDLMHGGCASGYVSELVYTADCVKFFEEHKREIGGLLAELLDDCGGTIGQMFDRAGWEKSDPLALEEVNQNILAWFGFEETARRLAERAGIEL